MTNPNLAHVQLIIDRSGSMQSLRSTVVDGINKFLAAQRKMPGVCHVGLCWFGGTIDQVYDNKPLSDVQDLLLGDYMPDGGTPLHEAMITSIDRLGARLAVLPENDRPGLVTVLTITDGEENASGPSFTADAVKQRVERQTKSYNWNFQYLCANQDAVLAANKLGISLSNAAAYSPTIGNTQAVFMAASAATLRGRSAVLHGFSAQEAVASMAYSVDEIKSLVEPTA